jgi:hypothetical protein
MTQFKVLIIEDEPLIALQIKTSTFADEKYL